MVTGPKSFLDPSILNDGRLKLMENAVLGFLQGLFATFPPRGIAGSIGLHYDHENVDNTEINIEGQYTDNLQTVDNRPKITVARGPVSFQQAGINASIGSQNLSLAKQRHAIIMAGSVGISCYSKEELESDRMAEICARSIEAFQPIIRQYGFLEIRTSQIGQRALVKSDSRSELFVTPVMLRTSVTAKWTREVVDPVKLRTIVTNIILGRPVN